MEIKINNFNAGISFVLAVNPYDLVIALKNKIKEDHKLPVERQTISYNGAELQDHQTLAIFGITDGSTLNLFISMDVDHAASIARLRKEHAKWLKSGLRSEKDSDFAELAMPLMPLHVSSILNDSNLTEKHSKSYMPWGMSAKSKFTPIPFGLMFADSAPSRGNEDEDNMLRRQQQELVEKIIPILRTEIAELTGNFNVIGNKFSAVLRRRFFVLHEAQVALGRAVDKAHQVRTGIEMLSRMKLRLSKPLPLPVTLAINACVRGFLLLVENKKSQSPPSSYVVEQVFGLFKQLLECAPPLSLCDGPNFNPEIVNSMQPLISYVRSFVSFKPLRSDSKSLVKDLSSLLRRVNLESKVTAFEKEGMTKLSNMLEVDDPIVFKGILPSLLDRARLWKALNELRSSSLTTLVSNSDSHTYRLRELALQLLFDWGLARASVGDMFELVNTLLELLDEEHLPSKVNRGKSEELDHENSKSSFFIFRPMKVLLSHRVPGKRRRESKASLASPKSESESSTESDDLLEYHHSHLVREFMALKKSVAERKLEKKEHENFGHRIEDNDIRVPTTLACSLIISQLRRISKPLGEENPDLPAQLYVPLRLHVKARTFVEIVRVLRYGEQKLRAAKEWGKQELDLIHLMFNTLHILKIHVYQFVESKVAHKECGLTSAIVNKIREILWRLITSPLLPLSTENGPDGNFKGRELASKVMFAVSKIAASIITYEFFYVSVTHKIEYLASLVAKRNKMMANSQKLFPPEEHVYLLLLNEISSIETGARLVNALVQSSNPVPDFLPQVHKESTTLDSKDTKNGDIDEKIIPPTLHDTTEQKKSNLKSDDDSKYCRESQLKFICALLDASALETKQQLKEAISRFQTDIKGDTDAQASSSTEKSANSAESPGRLISALLSYQGHFLAYILSTIKDSTAELLTLIKCNPNAVKETKKSRIKIPLESEKKIENLLSMLVPYASHVFNHSSNIAAEVCKVLAGMKDRRRARMLAENVLNDSIVGQLCIGLSTWLCLLFDLHLGNAHVKVKKVSSRGGLVVRRSVDQSSPVEGTLVDGQIVTVLCTHGSVALVHTPIHGWVPTEIDGKPSLTGDSLDNDNMELGLGPGQVPESLRDVILVKSMVTKVPLRLTPVVSKFLQTMEVLLNEISKFPDSTARAVEHREIETSHPYHNSFAGVAGLGSDVERIEIPNAQKITISFDPRCELPPGETLQIFEDEKLQKPMTLQLSGKWSKEDWKDIEIKASSVIYIQTKYTEASKAKDSDSKQRGASWGYRIALMGVVRRDHLEWASRVAHTCAWLVGCMCAKLVTGHPATKGEMILGSDRKSNSLNEKSGGNTHEIGGHITKIFAKGIPMKDVFSVFPKDLRIFFEKKTGKPNGEGKNPFAVLTPDIQELAPIKEEKMFINDLVSPKGPKGLAYAFMQSMYEQHKDPFKFMIKSVREDSGAIFRAVLAVLLRHTGRLTQACRIANEHSKAADEGLDHPPLLRRTSSASPASIGLVRIWRAAQSSSQRISTLVAMGKDHHPFMFTLLERARLLLHVQPAYRRAAPEGPGRPGGERKGHRRNRDMTKLRGLLKLQQNRVSAKGHKPEDAVVQALLHFLRPVIDHKDDTNESKESLRDVGETLVKERNQLMHNMTKPPKESDAPFSWDSDCSLLWDGLIVQHVRAVVLLVGLRMFRSALGILKRPSLVIQVLHHLILIGQVVKKEPKSREEKKGDGHRASDGENNTQNMNGQNSESAKPLAQGSLKADHFLSKLPAANDQLRGQLTEEYFAIVSYVTRQCLKAATPRISSSQHLKKISSKSEGKTEKKKRERKQKCLPQGHAGKQITDSALDQKLPLWTLKLYEIGLYNESLLLSDVEQISRTNIVESLAPLLNLPTATKNELIPGSPTLQLNEIPWNLRYASWLLMQLVAYSTFSNAHTLVEKSLHSIQTPRAEDKRNGATATATVMVGNNVIAMQRSLLDIMLKNMKELVLLKNRHLSKSRHRAALLAKRGRVERKNIHPSADQSGGRIGPQHVGFTTIFSEGSTGIEYDHSQSSIPGYYTTIAKVVAPKGDSCWNAISNVRVTRGKWYYEVRFTTAPEGGTGAPCYIGWSGKDFTALNSTTGCGDTDDSWSFSPFGPGPSWHRGNQKRYPMMSNPPRAKVGSILGCEISIDDKEMAEIVWYIDGVNLGTAYTGFKIPNGGIAPAAGLLKGEVEFIFHRNLLKNLPADAMPFEDTQKTPQLNIFSRTASVQDVGDYEWNERCREMHACDAATTWYMHSLVDCGYLGPAPSRLHPPSTGEIELFLIQYLFLILRCTRFPYVQKVIQDLDWVNLLLEVLKGSSSVALSQGLVADTAGDRRSTMSTHLVLKLLHIVLPNIKPTHPSLRAFSWNNKRTTSSSSFPSPKSPGSIKSSSTGDCPAIVSFLFSEIGTASHDWYVTETSADIKAGAWNEQKKTSLVKQSVATGEYIALCRVLLSSPLWNSYMNAKLLEVLNGLEEVSKKIRDMATLLSGADGKDSTSDSKIKHDSKCISSPNSATTAPFGSFASVTSEWKHMNSLKEIIQPIFAALSVLGGYVESIREGSRVLAPTSDDELVLGTVSRLRSVTKGKEVGSSNGKQESMADVQLDTGAIVLLPVWKLTPAPSKPITQGSAEQQPKIMDIIMSFLAKPVPDYSKGLNATASDPTRMLSLQLVHAQLRRRCLAVMFELLRVPANVEYFVRKNYPSVLRQLALPHEKEYSPKDPNTIPLPSSSISVLQGRVLFLEQRLAKLSSTHPLSHDISESLKEGGKNPSQIYTCPPDAMFLVSTKSDHFSELKTHKGIVYTCLNRVPRNYFCGSSINISATVSTSRKGKPRLLDSGAVMLGQEGCCIDCKVKDVSHGMTFEFQMKLDPKKLAKELASPRFNTDEKFISKTIFLVQSSTYADKKEALSIASSNQAANNHTKVDQPTLKYLKVDSNIGCRLKIIDPELTAFALEVNDGKSKEVRKEFLVSLKEKRRVGGKEVIRFRCKSSKFYLAYINDREPLKLAEVGEPGCKDIVQIPANGAEEEDSVQFLFDLSPDRSNGKDQYLTLNGSSQWQIKPQRYSFVALWNTQSKRFLKFNASKKTVSLAAAEEGKGSSISDVCLFEIDKVYREWSSIAVTISPGSTKITAHINGSPRCQITAADGVDIPAAISGTSTRLPSYTVNLPGELDVGIRRLRFWRHELQPKQIFSLLSPTSLRYLYEPKYANAFTKRSRSIANHVFLPNNLPPTASLNLSTPSPPPPTPSGKGKVIVVKNDISTKSSHRLEKGKYQFDPQGFELPLGASLEMKAGLGRTHALRDYTLEMDFMVDFTPWTPKPVSESKQTQKEGYCDKERMLTILDFNSNDPDSARVLLDRATGALVITCRARMQDSPPDLHHSKIEPLVWHRLQLCVCPTRTVFSLDGQKMISITWRGWKDQSGGLFAGMRVIRMTNKVENGNDSEWNGSTWEAGKLLSYKRQESNWVLNVRWNNTGKEGEVVWPNSNKVRVIDSDLNARMRPTDGMKVMIRIGDSSAVNGVENSESEAYTEDNWYNGTIQSCEEESWGSWMLQIAYGHQEMREIVFPGESSNDVILLTPEIMKLNSNDGASKLMPADLDALQAAKEKYPEAFRTLKSMGFPEIHCCRALVASFGDREQAVEWVLQHENRVPATPMRSNSFEFPNPGSPDKKDLSLKPESTYVLLDRKLYEDQKFSKPRVPIRCSGRDEKVIPITASKLAEKAVKTPETGFRNKKDSNGKQQQRASSREYASKKKKAPKNSSSPSQSLPSTTNHNFRLGNKIMLFDNAGVSQDKNDTPRVGWVTAKVKWVRIERSTAGKCEPQPCVVTREGSQGPWNWPSSGLTSATEKQIQSILSNTEGTRGLHMQVIQQGLVQSGYDLTDAWRLLTKLSTLRMLKTIVEASKLSNAVSSLGALGYSTAQCKSALACSGDKLQPALLWLLDHKIPLKVFDNGGWRLTKANGISALYPLFTDSADGNSNIAHFLFSGDASDGSGGSLGRATEDDEVHELASATTKKAWSLHLKNLEHLNELPIQGVKTALLNTELAFISRCAIACAVRTMQQQLKDLKIRGSDVLLMFEKTSNGEKSAKFSGEPLFFTKLIRLAHLSQNKVQLRILREILIQSLNDEAKTMLQSPPAKKIELQAAGKKKLDGIDEKSDDIAKAAELRRRFPVGFAISLEYTLHMFGYIMKKLFPHDNSKSVEDVEEANDTAPRVGSKVMVASSGGGYYYKWEVSSADLMDDGRWKLGVRRGATNESYVYPSPSNRIILLPNPALTTPETGMRILGRHDAWYPGRISNCHQQPTGSTWEVHIAYDDGDTDMLTFPGPASHPIILLGDSWNRTQANATVSKRKEEQGSSELISVKATDAVIHPNIDLALWIVELLLEFQNGHSKRSPELLLHLQPLLFSEAVINAMFEIIRSGGGSKGADMRLAFVFLMTNLVRTFGHRNLLTIVQVHALKVFMLDLFQVHTSTNSLKNLVPSPLFQAVVELNLCIARQLPADSIGKYVDSKQKWFHQLIVMGQVLDALQPSTSGTPGSRRGFLPSTFVEPLWKAISREMPEIKSMGSRILKRSTLNGDNKERGKSPSNLDEKREMNTISAPIESMKQVFELALKRVENQLAKQKADKRKTDEQVKPRKNSTDMSKSSTNLYAKKSMMPRDNQHQQIFIKPRHKAFHLNDSIFALIPGADEQLVRLVRDYCEKRSLPLYGLEFRDFDPSEEELLHCKKLEQVITQLGKKYLQIRLFVLQRINNELIPLLENLVDLTQPSTWETLANKVRRVRSLIFWTHKERLWQRALNATVLASSVPAVNLDRMKAIRLREQGGVDTKGTISVFGQSFRQLRNQDCFRVSTNARAFRVYFIGEHAIDAGGPYRAAITDMCDELQSSVLPLFIPCPNSRDAIGENRDKWVPNPSSTRPIHLKMYEFVGKLMGLAMRSSNLLELDLPSIIWKPLVLLKPAMEDLKGIDLICFKIIERLSAFDKVENGREASQNFDQFQLDFTCVRSDQKIVKLVKDGTRKKVTWENRKLYMKLLMRERLNEFRIQCAAIRRGLAAVVPASIFTLFTHSELEIAVCGSPVISVDLLQENTTYTYPTKGTDSHIKMFWKMMRDLFTQQDRVKFLRFVWGRSRHPRDKESWGSEKFHIAPHTPSQNSSLGADGYHPSAHTCFFTLELPEYSTLEIMYSKVLYAITHCTAVDGDSTFNAARQIVYDDSDSDTDERSWS